MKAKCNHKCSILGNMDYLGAIDRMANAVTPKGYLPISNVKYGAMLDMPKERAYKKFMHLGPAQTSSLNKNQTSHLVHELRERGYSSKAAKEAAHEGKELSRKYMNSPWAKVPLEYRKKYGAIDFDGDGLPNSMDCFPFDYDRQATFGSSKSKSSGSGSMLLSAAKKVTSPVSSSVKSSSIQYIKDGLGNTVLNQAYKAPTASSTKISSPTISSRTFSSSSSAGDMVYYEKNADGSIGKEITTPAGYITKTQSTVSGETTTYDPSGTVISKTPGKIPTSGGSSRSSTSIQPSQSQISYLDIYTEKYVPNYENVPDQEKYNILYNEILAGKINDPNAVRALMEKIAPYKQQYDFNSRVLQSKNIFEQKKRALLISPDTEFLNQKIYQRRQDILQSRANRGLEETNRIIEDVTSKFNKEIQSQAESEAAQRKGEAMSKQVSGYDKKYVLTGTTNPSAKASVINA